MTERPIFRFAPSPNGELHLGHALSAILNFDMAKEVGGRFLLRIEDIDPARCRPEYEGQIYDDLRWLGLDWEEPVRRQSEHVAEYQAALDQLKSRGLVYPAFLSRAEVKAHVGDYERNCGRWKYDPDGSPHYPTGERDLDPVEAEARIARGERHMWRLNMEKALAQIGNAPHPNPLPVRTGRGDAGNVSGATSPFSPSLRGEDAGRQMRGSARTLTWTETNTGTPQSTPANPSVWGDVVLCRWDAPSSYHLSVVLDDALQGVTHVVRGMDLFHATHVHRLLQVLFGLPAPTYYHHPLIKDESGQKLSKSIASTGIRTLREAGETPSGIRRRLGLPIA
ncbi:glutamyl-Q tRNA(Asp) synthetase [Rhizobium sp. LjRoot254]|uniref:glutamyl-Q tRNA(Asp) synthetase n=1 Tax=Rhizobium sp. LjRoot254 TaxID=3342297 RepID=UPI003ECF9757